MNNIHNEHSTPSVVKRDKYGCSNLVISALNSLYWLSILWRGKLS